MRTYLLPVLLLGCTDAGVKDSAVPADSASTEPCPVAASETSSLTWTALLIGAAEEQSVLVVNNCVGNGRLELEAVADAPFTVAPNAASVLPGESASFAVRAMVSDHNEVTGLLSIATNDPAAPEIEVALVASADPDQDGDGFEYAVDCDDGDADVHPGSVDTWYDGIDSDCAGDNDQDQDADGWELGLDCDDVDAAVSPDAQEICNGLDDDCDGDVDDGASDERTWYDDADGDGFGEPTSGYLACDAPVGFVEIADDCDDGDSEVNPSVVESCDGTDNNCDGVVDEAGASDETTWYLDADGDGFGTATAAFAACDPPIGYSGAASDCDDTRDDVHPGAVDVCNSTDDDCDGAADGDSDGDGYAVCDDCDDRSSGVHPAASEVCGDVVDDDCDGDAPACRPEGAFDLSTRSAKLIGEGPLDQAGTTDAIGGDVNGDGYPDLLVGAWLEDGAGADSGAVYLVYGPVYGDLSLSAADAKWTGEVVGDYAGEDSVAFGGDLDGDGLDDVLVGVAQGDHTFLDAGAVYVLSSSSVGSSSLSGAAVKLVGVDYVGEAGRSVSGVGDVNGDSFDDMFVGAPGADSNTGASYLIYGPVAAGSGDLSIADVVLTGETTRSRAGEAITSAGDMDGDGFDDLLIGAYLEDSAGTDAGAAYLVFGPPASSEVSLSDADAKLTGEAADDLAGEGLAGGVDLNSDGYMDVLVGARSNDRSGTSAGAVYLAHGPLGGTMGLAAADVIFTGEDASDQIFVARAGDIDGDGALDIVIGAPNAGDTLAQQGISYLLYGPTFFSVDMSSADASFVGEDGGDYAGMSEVGDLDGDTLDDLFIGASGDDDGGNYAGAAYIYYASDL